MIVRSLLRDCVFRSCVLFLKVIGSSVASVGTPMGFRLEYEFGWICGDEHCSGRSISTEQNVFLYALGNLVWVELRELGHVGYLCAVVCWTRSKSVLRGFCVVEDSICVLSCID